MGGRVRVRVRRVLSMGGGADLHPWAIFENLVYPLRGELAVSQGKEPVSRHTLDSTLSSDVGLST